MKVSDLVTTKEIEAWIPGDIITIKAGTGKGKSHFIKNDLYEFAKRNNKRILMLIHRRNCTDQFLLEIKAANKEDVIDIRTYQSIEAVEKSGIIYELGMYDIIVADEWHYFMSDASFNKYTDISLDAILEQINAIRIFMSATGDHMKHYLSDSKHRGLTTIDYEIPIDFNFIKRLEFFHENETLETYIEQAIKLNKKAILFIQSAKKAYALHEKYEEHTLFNCSKHNKDGYYQYVDSEKINNMLKNERFESLILITTCVFDAGVNIVDDELNHIVADVDDTGTLIQCIGRKRLQNKDDYINLHVKVINNNQLGGLETQAREKLNMALHFRKFGEKSLVHKYPRANDNSHIIYDAVTKDGIEKRLNEMMFFKAVTDVNEIEEIKKMGKDGYIKHISKLFEIVDYGNFEETKKRNGLENYLDAIVGSRLFKDDQEKLIKRIDLRVDGKRQRSFKKLNEALEMIKLDFVIIRNVDRSRKLDNGEENLNRGKTYWEIIKSLG